MKIISISIPGFGLSEGPPVSPHNLTQFAHDVAAVVDKEGVENFHLIGYGAGGIQAVAATFGNIRRVQNFLLLAPLTPASITGVDAEAAPETLMMKRIWALPLIGKAFACAVAKLMSAQTRFDLFHMLNQNFALDLLRLQNDGNQINVHGQQLDLVEFLYEDQYHSLSHSWHAISPELVVNELPFDLTDVRVQGSVGVAFSLDDAVHPPAMSRWYCDRIPACKLIKYDTGYGHRFPLAKSNIERTLQFIKHGKEF